jgi:uncharacterized protein YjbJ (UPF0337 family)
MAEFDLRPPSDPDMKSTRARGASVTDGKDTAAEARKGLASSITGKVKEVGGALLGNDSLTREGQLQQTESKERREANAQEAVADAEARRAEEKLRAENEQAREEQQQAASEEAVRVASAGRVAAQQEHQAETEAAVRARAGELAAEQKAGDEIRNARVDALGAQAEATAEEQRGEQEKERLAAQSAAAEAQAAQTQRKAEALETELDRT